MLLFEQSRAEGRDPRAASQPPTLYTESATFGIVAQIVCEREEVGVGWGGPAVESLCVRVQRKGGSERGVAVLFEGFVGLCTPDMRSSRDVQTPPTLNPRWRFKLDRRWERAGAAIQLTTAANHRPDGATTSALVPPWSHTRHNCAATLAPSEAPFRLF